MTKKKSLEIQSFLNQIRMENKTRSFRPISFQNIPAKLSIDTSDNNANDNSSPSIAVTPSSDSKSVWDFAASKSSPLRRSVDMSATYSTPSPRSSSSGYTNLSFDFQNAVNISNDSDANNRNNVAPEIVSRTQDTAIQAGGTVMLCCVIRHANDAQIIWRRTEPGPPMLIQTTSSKFNVSIGSNGEARLIINQVDIRDSGVYVCIVSSPFGLAQCSIGLTVLPEQHLSDDGENECHTEIYLEIINPTSVRVSWDYTASTTNSYIIEYCRTSSNSWQSNGDKPVRSRYILSGLTPGESYTFRLVSSNSNFISLPSTSITMPLTEHHMWQQQQFNNRYTAMSELGRGRFAVIRLATDAVTGQKVALKQISRRQQDLITTQEEYKVLASAQHPNIVRGLALFENAPHQGVDTVVMELYVFDYEFFNIFRFFLVILTDQISCPHSQS